ncbi:MULTISPECIES: SAM-dependent methyltransferase [Pseudofrankia]|uniref:SAM-dependent methyltransferase n=1 Tax=Pseudofrankia TaxID=2994363 RepID=UPI000234CD38|nr:MULTISPECIES: SAM-dependent methyltransferase [Pseudofrankia]OHV41548.1 methyltransferase [Pseudofrankia sp. EUN1h]
MSDARSEKQVDEARAADLRVDVPHTARIYDYLLGGKDNFPADREAAERTLAVSPLTRPSALANRAFLHRATRFLAVEAGIRQFLDIGTGIPTSPNLHEVAQGVAPDARVVYVDNDPIVLVHARALLTSSPEGRTGYIDADLRDPAKVLGSIDFRATIDLSQPVALTIFGVLHFIADTSDPHGLVRRYLDALPSGSFLALTHGSLDFDPESVQRGADVYEKRGISSWPRPRAEIERFFDGLELVEPGLVPMHLWRPDGTDSRDPAPAGVVGYGGVARKP